MVIGDFTTKLSIPLQPSRVFIIVQTNTSPTPKRQISLSTYLLSSRTGGLKLIIWDGRSIFENEPRPKIIKKKTVSLTPASTALRLDAECRLIFFHFLLQQSSRLLSNLI